MPDSHLLHPAAGNYVVISPVRDEGPYVEITLRSVAQQSLRPKRWIIVDDGSRDSTAQILSRYSEQHPWITVLPLTRNGGRRPGSAVISAFMAGYKEVENEKFDFVVKLDCDLDIPPDYFQNLVHRFGADHKLGIASGIYLEASQNVWKPVRMPEYHAAGCSKMVRAECFRQIGGFIPERGWDTVDEIRAQVMGWKTAHFPEITLKHLKAEGVGIGFMRTNLMHGQIYFLTGGGLLFFLLKVLHRMVKGTPFLIAGFVMLFGYLRAWINREPRLVNDTEAMVYRRLLSERIFAPWKELFTRHKASGQTMGCS